MTICSICTMTICSICYVYVFAILAYLTTVNQCLTIFFFSKNYVSLERSPLKHVKKKHQNFEKVEMEKMVTANPLL